MVKLIAGLGNPGKEYENTRHNVGYEVLDMIKSKWETIDCASKFDAEVCETHQNGQKVFLFKSKTFMNESGKPIGKFCRFYKIKPEEILIIYDDLDLPLGHLRLSEGGSAGGHKGVQSAIDNVGANFWRLRVGIGSNRDTGLPAEAYVLQKFNPQERKIITNSMNKAVEIIKELIDDQDVNQQIAEYNKTL